MGLKLPTGEERRKVPSLLLEQEAQLCLHNTRQGPTTVGLDLRRKRIRALNDQIRQLGPSQSSNVRWLITAGVHQLGTLDVIAAIERTRTFDAFDADNDPHSEHDFGAFDLAGHRIFWKIDYYSLDLSGGSPDPAEEAVTCRVLTIMLSYEY